MLVDASATDRAGNTTAAARLILPIDDKVPPTLTLATENGRLDIASGQTFNVVANAEDEVGVTRVQLTGTGAFTVSDDKQVSPPTGSATVVFTMTAPEGATPGSVLNLVGRATDTSNNVSAAATLSLTVRSVTDVVLPESALILAGETQQIPIQLPAAALVGGLRVDLTISDPLIASVPAFVAFAEGETTRTFTLSGVSGGVATVTASVQGIPRATTTATVRGGIVSGIVRDPSGSTVSGVQLTVSSSGNSSQVSFSVTSGADGRYFVEGANLPAITVGPRIQRRVSVGSAQVN